MTVRDKDMQDTNWRCEHDFTLTDNMLLGVLGIVVVTLWWRAIADLRGLRHNKRRGDAAFRHAPWRKERTNVVLEFIMAIFVTLASACVLIALHSYY